MAPDTIGSHDSAAALEFTAPAALLVPLAVDQEVIVAMTTNTARTLMTTAFLLDLRWEEALDQWPQDPRARTAS